MELLSSLLKAFYLRKHEQTFIFLCGDFETVHTNVYISRAFPPLCRLLTLLSLILADVSVPLTIIEIIVCCRLAW